MASIAALVNFLLTFGRNFLTWAYNAAVDLINVGIVGFSAFCTSVVSLFPSGTSLPTFSTPVGGVLDSCLVTLNWVFPVGFFVSVLGFLVAAYLAYWLIAPLARWVKLLT